MLGAGYTNKEIWYMRVVRVRISPYPLHMTVFTNASGTVIGNGIQT